MFLRRISKIMMNVGIVDRAQVINVPQIGIAALVGFAVHH